MKLLILPGDGIGPEIMSVNRQAIEGLKEKFDLSLDLHERDIGFRSLKKDGSTFPKEILADARNANGTILGPVSSFDYPPKEKGGVSPSATLRVELELFANLRPSRTRPSIASVAKNLDILVVRENTEGFYSDRNMFAGLGEFMPDKDLALSVRKISRHASQRIARKAFELSIGRSKKVTVVHKANVLKMTDGLFLSVAREVAKDFPGVLVEELIVDAAAAHLIRRPEEFDVVLTTNMYGDILSDQIAELSGGLGLGGSINLGATHCVAQAAHGSAPDISGQDIANPSALMLSTVMLFKWIGEKYNQSEFLTAATLFEDAIEAALTRKEFCTPDIGGNGTTSSFGAEVCKIIKAKEG